MGGVKRETHRGGALARCVDARPSERAEAFQNRDHINPGVTSAMEPNRTDAALRPPSGVAASPYTTARPFF